METQDWLLVVIFVLIGGLTIYCGLQLEHVRDSIANLRGKQAACAQHAWEWVISNGTKGWHKCKLCGREAGKNGENGRESG